MVTTDSERSRVYHASHRDERLVKMAAYYEANADKIRQQQRARHLRCKYGLTAEQYEELLEQQGGGCAVCGQVEETRHHVTDGRYSLAVDHNHETGEVRGLLCRHCNLALGYVGDDIDRLRSLIAYLAAR